mmetsp:Transcript_35556/g.82320  ORF Transcript_35556/g.82320 Transcript_35556/m.82320 type:complete len:294 (+) Transcript_35556:322-1203(+)
MHACDLREDCLLVAPVAEVACEASAQARSVVADATAAAVAPLLVAITVHDIRAGRALLERAVRPAVARVANAAGDLLSIPRCGICHARLLCQELLRVADTVLAAVVRAHGPLARNTRVAIEALADATLALADAFVRALDHRVGLVGGGGDSHPCRSLWAGALGAIGCLPRRIPVRPGPAVAFSVPETIAVARALFVVIVLRTAAAHGFWLFDLEVLSAIVVINNYIVVRLDRRQVRRRARHHGRGGRRHRCGGEGGGRGGRNRRSRRRNGTRESCVAASCCRESCRHGTLEAR